MIGVRELAAGEGGQWKKFLEASNKGTLFHDLEFLAYNNHKNFRTRHLVFCEDGRTAALLPAAVVASPDGGAILESPYGAYVTGIASPRLIAGAVTVESAETATASRRAAAEAAAIP